jgi:hypothetical protein
VRACHEARIEEKDSAMDILDRAAVEDTEIRRLDP